MSNVDDAGDLPKEEKQGGEPDKPTPAGLQKPVVKKGGVSLSVRRRLKSVVGLFSPKRLLKSGSQLPKKRRDKNKKGLGVLEKKKRSTAGGSTESNDDGGDGPPGAFHHSGGLMKPVEKNGGRSLSMRRRLHAFGCFLSLKRVLKTSVRRISKRPSNFKKSKINKQVKTDSIDVDSLKMKNPDITDGVDSTKENSPTPDSPKNTTTASSGVSESNDSPKIKITASNGVSPSDSPKVNTTASSSSGISRSKILRRIITRPGQYTKDLEVLRDVHGHKIKYGKDPSTDDEELERFCKPRLKLGLGNTDGWRTRINEVKMKFKRGSEGEEDDEYEDWNDENDEECRLWTDLWG